MFRSGVDVVLWYANYLYRLHSKRADQFIAIELPMFLMSKSTEKAGTELYQHRAGAEYSA
jgi:hypothetical protein